MNDQNLKNDERVILELRSLYQKYGYVQYKMSKFEEYDLYVRNKNFLNSEEILTFTDLNGKLMALKPDVTLSIVKNTKDDDKNLQKVYYNENIYRVSGGTNEFKEIMQTGLECIGELDRYSVCEVIMLAAKSLETISNNYILDICHMGIISGLLDDLDIIKNTKAKLLHLVGEKNTHGLRDLCQELNIEDTVCETLTALTMLYGQMGEKLIVLKPMCTNSKMQEAYEELSEIYEIMCVYGLDKNLFMDFSVINDMNYYSGITFQGFVDDISAGVLSGGRYDNLIRRMGKKGGAIGFAVYLNMLERLNQTIKPYDVDVLLIHDENTEAPAIIQTVKLLNESGKSVKVQKEKSDKIRYRQLISVNSKGLEILETND